MACNKFWRRIWAIAVVSAMTLSVAACGAEKAETGTEKSVESKSTESKSEDKSIQSTEEKQAEYDPLGAYEDTLHVTIGSLLWELPADLSDGATNEDNAYKDLVKEVLNVEYEYMIEAYDSGGYNTQVSLAIASEELPDIMYINDLSVLYELVENDLIEDLTDDYNNYVGESQKNMYDSYDYNVFDKVTFDGKIMALPRCWGEPENLIWIRQDWLEALDIQVDEDGNRMITREELEMVAKEFVENDPGKSGNPVGIAVTSILGSSADSTTAVVNSSFGAHHRYWFRAQDGSVYNGSTVPEVKNAMAWWADMYSKGLLDPQFGIRNWAGGVELLLNGQSGIYFGEMSAPSWYVTALYDSDPNAKFSAYALDDGTGKTITAHYDMTNRYIVVRKGFEHPEVVIKLANLFQSTVDNPNLAEEYPLVYEYHQKGQLYNIDPLHLASGDADTDLQVYAKGQAYMDGTLAKEDIFDPNAINLVGIIDKYMEDPASLTAAEQGMYEYYMEGVKTIATLQEQGLLEYVTPLKLGVTETMSSKQADLFKLEGEVWVKIVTGEASLDEFDAFVEEWNARGGTKIAEEIVELLQ